MTGEDITLWLVALGTLSSAISFLTRPPEGGGLRYWNPLSRRERLSFAIGAAGVLLLVLGAAGALIPSSSVRISRWVVVPGTAALFVSLVYFVAVAQLYRDRQVVLREHVGSAWQREIAQSTARLTWCARHPLIPSEWWPGGRAAQPSKSHE
jgi:hypothetical protein